MSALRVLVTGYEPFGGEPLNPSEQLVLALRQQPPDDPRVELHTAVLPVDSRRLRAELRAALVAARPHVVLALGQAAGRATLDLERTAFNALDFGEGADNGGRRAHGEALHPGAPEALVSGLPLAGLAAELCRRGHAVGLSDDAGRHLCNALLYELLWRHPQLEAAFVHLPALPEQAERRGQGEPALPGAASEACLRELLELLGQRFAG